MCSDVLGEMGAKQKKAFKKNLKKASSMSLVSTDKNDAADFLPLAGGPGRKLPVEKPPVNKSTVLYIGRIPHGFYEKEMQAFFSQFGAIKRLRVARNKKTGKAKHFGFIEFNDPEVAEVVADTMHGYLLFEHLLQVHLIPPEHVHPKLHGYIWRGFNPRYKPMDWVQEERKRQNKERTLMEHKKLVDKILKRDQKRRKRIEAAGIEYECPEIVSSLPFFFLPGFGWTCRENGSSWSGHSKEVQTVILGKSEGPSLMEKEAAFSSKLNPRLVFVSLMSGWKSTFMTFNVLPYDKLYRS
ncbi:hypothetical protein JRO89_XS14G0015700 [Xanthoceras sorbifolium]|uniref:RRM domain-containing protein n=1 Tax=Xanthoceras sorbifolium TaxID=99658 RepID=A0ABQ8H399_9ROSI|nr:hypothetical protein JRO89_XS14G0015700 [Xanthoceras sorbifolium]